MTRYAEAIALVVAYAAGSAYLLIALARAEAAEADVQAMDDAHHAEWMKLTAEVARYREALERIAAHDYSFDEYEQIARQALTGADEDG